MKTNIAYVDDEVTIRIDSEELNKSKDLKTESGLNLTDRIEDEPEKWYLKLIQIVIPFLIAGFGMVSAGLLLEKVQDWELFIVVREIVVLVPALLGLKGNLEMTLASRLSTQLNLGIISDRKTIINSMIGNSALIQLQSIVAGFLASFVACLTDYIRDGMFTPPHFLTIIVSSIVTASLASLLLGNIVMFITIVSKHFNVNPDNIAVPIAASLGDVVTLAILSCMGSIFFNYRHLFGIHVGIMVFYASTIPLLVYYCNKNDLVRETLYHGWMPIISGMLISSVAGVILDLGIELYESIAIFQPVVNGVGGNLVAVYASRLSTALYKTSDIGAWSSWAPKKFFMYPFEAFFGNRNPEANTAKMLVLLIIPGHTLFFFTSFLLDPSEHRPDLTFTLVLFYLIFVFIQVIILLILGYILVHVLWRLKKNPNNYTIPLLTATGDLLGVSLLFLCFYLVYLTGNKSLMTHLENNSANNFNFTNKFYNSTHLPKFQEFLQTN